MKFSIELLLIKLLVFKSAGANESLIVSSTDFEDVTTLLAEITEDTTSFDDISTDFPSTSTDAETTTESFDSSCSITSHNYTLNVNNTLHINWTFANVISCENLTVQVSVRNLTCEEKCNNTTNAEPDYCQNNCTINEVSRHYLRSLSLKSCTKYKYILTFANKTYESEEFWSNVSELKIININDSFRDSDTKILDLYVFWEYDCAEKFVVSIQYDNNFSDKTVNEMNSKFEDVEACTNYTITVNAAEGNNTVSKSSFYETTSIEPSQIRNLTVTSRAKTLGGSEIAVFDVKWEKPVQGSRCVKYYNIFLESEFDNRVESVESESCSNACLKEIYEVYPCVSYSIKVEISLNDTQEEEATTTIMPSFSTTQQVNSIGNEKSEQANNTFYITAYNVKFAKLDQPNITDVTNTTFDISITVNTTQNKCEIKSYEYQCINEEIESNRTEFSIKSSITLSDLEPSTEYLCSVRILNEAGFWSEQGSYASRETLEGSPNAPSFKILHESIKSTEFTLIWEKPSKPRGDINNYVINIKFMKFLHRNPIYCSLGPDNSEFNKTFYVNEMNIDYRNYTFTEAVPSSIFSVQIRANNVKTEGEWSKQERVETKPDKSEAVLLGIAQTPMDISKPFNNTAVLNWTYPCKSNSNLTTFEIRYSSENDNSVKINVTFVPGKYEYEYGLNLTPSKSYRIGILPYSDVYAGKEAESNFTLDAGVPEDLQINSIIKNVKIHNKAKQTVTLSQLQHLFESSVGRVEYIIFLLHQTGCNLVIEKKRNFITADNSDEIPNYTDPSNQKCIGQYKTAKILNPMGDFESFTIGSESCNNQEKQICNGPLKTGTHYALIMRFFTKNGFADSEMIKFDTDKQTPIAIIIISFLTIICIVFIIGFYITYRNPRNSVNKQYDREDVPVQNFQQFYNEMTKNNNERLREEYKQIQFFSEGLTHQTTLASKTNEKYNRYANIAPFDSNRVVLNDDEFEHDYINASFINGYYFSKEYIAAQGPKTNTSHDFWRMVLQYKIKSIVMLTSLVENNKVKCHEYFPKINGQVIFDNIKIVCTNEQKYPCFIKRIMEVQKDDIKHKVKHYYFLKWMDHSACNASDLIDFVKLVRSEREHPSESFIVHCSAGVGRTGTFVALDILMQRIKQEKKINIFVLVKELRRQRMKMVQTFDQYALVYGAALEMTTSRTRRPRVLRNISMYIENIELFKNWTRRGNLRNSSDSAPKIDDKESAL